MAAWYYTKDGANFGPYTEETMIELINNGSVTFVTMVWNADTGNEEREWLYAYDTDLAVHFSHVADQMAELNFQMEDAPPVPAPVPIQEPEENKVAPEPEPEPPAPEPPEKAELPSRASVKANWRHGNDSKLAVVFLVLFVAGLAIGASAWYFTHRNARERIRIAMYTEKALPAVPVGDMAVVKLTDMSVPASAISGMREALASIARGLVDKEPERGAAIQSLASALDAAGELIGAADEISALVSAQSGGLYIAMIVRDDALKLFMSKPSAFYSAVPWDGAPLNGKGWILSAPLAGDGSLYVASLRAESGMSMVYASTGEAGVLEMVSAYDEKTPGFTLKRMTNAPDFVQFRFQNGFTRRMMAEAFPGNPEAGALWMRAPDKALFTFAETSWDRNGNVFNSETYSDFLERNPGIAALRPKTVSEPMLRGDGELACFAAFDTGFIARALFSGSNGYASEAPDFIKDPTGGDIAAKLAPLLEAGRVSVLCTEKDGKARTAYAILETDSADALESAYNMYSPFTAALGGVPAKLDGWDSAVSMTMPFRDGASTNIVVAHKKGAFMAGAGDAEDFSKNLKVNDEYRDFTSSENLMNVIVSSKMCVIFIDMLESLPPETAGVSLREAGAAAVRAGALKNSFDSVCGNLKLSGRADGRVIVEKGGDPVAALFELFANTADIIPKRAERP